LARFDFTDKLFALKSLFEAKEEAASTKLEGREWYGFALLFEDAELRFAQVVAELERRLNAAGVLRDVKKKIKKSR
jgi:hypothetical protein